MTGFIPVAEATKRARSIDDLALSHISAHNIVNYDYEDGVYKTKATAMIFVKSLSTEIMCQAPTHVFNGEPWFIVHPYPHTNGVYSYIWYKHFPLLLDINNIRKIVAREGLDYLYKRWVGDKYPFIAARLGLLDWQTGLGISGKLLRDNKYSDYGLFRQLITKDTALHNGIISGIVEKQTQQTRQYKYDNDNQFDTNNDLTDIELNILFRNYGINLEELVRDVWGHTYIHLRNTMQLPKETFEAVTTQVWQYLINPDLYKTILELTKKKLKTDKDWRYRFMMVDNKPSIMIRDLIYILINNFIDSYLQKI